MAVTHNALHKYAAGLNNAPNQAGGSLPFPLAGLSGWKIYHENFASGALYTSDSNPYEITVEGTTPAIVVGVNGPSMPTLATDNTSILLQWTTPQIIPSATKKMYLETSVTLTASTMTSNETFIGFTSDQQTTNFVGATGVAWAFDDGFGFGKLDTATEIDFIARQSDAEQTIGLGSTFTSGTRTTLAAYYDGSTYYIYKDGVQVASASQEVFNNDAAMGLSCYVKTGAAEIQTLLPNYVTMAVEL